MLPRMIQLACGALLFGFPLFSLYGVRATGPLGKSLLWLALAGMALAAAFAAIVQTGALLGNPVGIPRIDDLAWYLRETKIGLVTSLRLLGLFGYAVLIGLRPPSTQRTIVQGILGAALLGSFAWTGHGAEGGIVHLMSDLVHLLMAGVWFGALSALCLLIFHARRNPEYVLAAADGLDAFSRVGVAVVALLVASGVGNTLFVFEWSNVSGLYQSEYGRALLIKLALFGGMLALAAANRFRLAPLLRHSLSIGDNSEQLRLLRFSLVSEITLALMVLGVAAQLGSIQPPAL